MEINHIYSYSLLYVPLDFSDANFCPLNSGPLDLNRLKIIDDISKPSKMSKCEVAKAHN